MCDEQWEVSNPSEWMDDDTFLFVDEDFQDLKREEVRTGN
jgi:hypothetical protein